MQAQVFTVVNHEDYCNPDLICVGRRVSNHGTVKEIEQRVRSNNPAFTILDLSPKGASPHF